MNIHPQLLEDCHWLGRLDRAELLLHGCAGVGWLILVPDTEAEDWPDLADEEYCRISRQTRHLSQWAAQWFQADRMNIATLGNQVPQMHVHIIGRHRGDFCWPAPVWGQTHLTKARYDDAAVAAIRQGLVKELRLGTRREEEQ